MTTLRPPPGFKRGLSERSCIAMAERALRSDLGQDALRQGWGRGLYRFVLDWGSTPQQPATIEKIKRAANDLLWELAELRERTNLDPLTRSHLRLLEKAAEVEAELKRDFLRKAADDQ